MLDHSLLVEQDSSTPADQQGGVCDIVHGELVLSVLLLDVIQQVGIVSSTSVATSRPWSHVEGAW
jgi:hypothetical protein